MKYISGVNRKQVILFPETIDEYIEANDPVRFIDAFVDSLELKELSFRHAELEPTGRPPYHPADLLKLYIYGYLNRVRSSRCLEKESKRNVELMWLLKKLSPDFKTIADFRKDNADAVKKVCKEFIFLCKRLDLFGGELVAIDGSKFKAVNSKHRNFNEGKLKKKLKGIEEKIEGYLRELEENDEKESGVNSPYRQELEAKIEELKERRGEHQKLLGKLEESGESQISLTDPAAGQ
jgi:Transposase and inactivated derivatives